MQNIIDYTTLTSPHKRQKDTKQKIEKLIHKAVFNGSIEIIIRKPHSHSVI